MALKNSEKESHKLRFTFPGLSLALDFTTEISYAVKPTGFIMKLPGMRGPRIIQFAR